MIALVAPTPGSPIPAIPVPTLFLAIPIRLAFGLQRRQIRQAGSYDKGYGNSQCKCILFQFLYVHDWYFIWILQAA
jgi:hypothetical protein